LPAGAAFAQAKGVTGKGVTGKGVHCIAWLCSDLNKISIYVECPVEYAEHIDVAVRSNEISDPIMTIKQNPNLFLGTLIPLAGGWKPGQ
jgi:hypothetical protein